MIKADVVAGREDLTIIELEGWVDSTVRAGRQCDSLGPCSAGGLLAIGVRARRSWLEGGSGNHWSQAGGCDVVSTLSRSRDSQRGQESCSRSMEERN